MLLFFRSIFQGSLFFLALACYAQVPATPSWKPASDISSSGFVLNWYATSNTSYYHVQVSLTSTFSSYTSAYNGVSSVGISGLLPGTTYYCRIQSVNSNGSSAFSSTLPVATVEVPPSSPVAFEPDAGTVKSNGFTAKWNAITEATSYRLDVSANIDFSSFVLNNQTVNSTSYAITGLSSGTVYYYRVRAYNSAGTSLNSNVITTGTLTSTPTAQLATNVTTNSFIANWTTVTGALNYQLEVSTKNDFSVILASYPGLTGPSYTVSPIADKTTIYYRVRALNSAGLPSAYSNVILGANLSQNYIRSVDIQVPGITTEAQVEAATNNQRSTKYDFFDGLGRPMQSVSVQASPGQQDVVQPIAYDAYGREAVKYLPYVSGNDGWYKDNFLPVSDANYATTSNAQYQFYQNTSKVSVDTKPYSETRFEPSPLNRVLEQGAPGTSWQPDGTDSYASTDRTIKKAYEFNLASEVLLWTYTYPTATYPLGLVNAGTASTPVYYAANQLYKNKTKDEEHREVIEYVDKEGRTVLKRVQVSTTSDASTTDTNKDTNWASTYYIYDDFGNLVCVVPPEATKLVATQFYHASATDATKDAFLNRWAFRYAYDGRNRMTHKQVPGTGTGTGITGTVYMVYDKRDRLVMTQDGNQRTPKQWTFTKYDALNRPVLTGIHTADSTLLQSKMQRRVDAYYAALATNNGAWFESYIGSAGVHGYDNKSYPLEATTSNYLTTTYYDNYNFKSLWPTGYDYETDNLSETVNGYTYTQPENNSYNQRVIGQVTGSKVRILDGYGKTWLKSVNYYDDKYRAVQLKSDNLKEGIDRTSTVYDFVGKVLKTTTTHTEGDILWTELTNALVAGNTIRKSGSSTWNSGARSEGILPAGKDGYLEWRAVDATYKMIGLSSVNSTDVTNITYAFNFQYTNGWVREGTTNGVTIPGGYVVGDLFKIERIGTTIRYYKNNNLVYTSAVASTTDLFVDIAMMSSSAYINDIHASFCGGKYQISRRFTYDHAGRLISTYHKLGNGELVNWSSLTAGLIFDGTKLAASTGGWTTGAFSTQSIPANTDGWVEFPAFEVSKNKMIGFSDANTNANYTSIDYALYLVGTSLRVYEGGANIITLGTFNANDVFRIERINGVVYYKQNGIVIYTSASTLQAPSTTALYADCSFNTTGGNIYAAYIGTGLGYSEVEIARNEYNELGQLVDKKVHLHPGTVAKQSVDYRYNIRGWLTSMNNADLTTISSINDETTDYFGMNLSYENIDTELGNAQLYNGNISAMKWSNYGGGTVKQKGYTYTYDPMNRITGSTYKENTTGWAALSNSGFAETGFTYDLNGNIKTLTRNDKRTAGLTMDILGYDYGATTAQSNRLLKVTDTGDINTGFKDGNTSGNDYTYDNNGNMTVDKNKGITAITYNHLNLPYIITKGGNTVTYLYDATGRKLAQVVTSNSTTKQTDYAGEFVYENDVLQFISHEEGRIVTANTKLTYANPCQTLTDFSGTNATLNTYDLPNTSEKYVEVVSSGTAVPAGIATVGGGFPVLGGERYKIRVKGYHFNAATTYNATLMVKVDGVVLNGTNPMLPKGSANESWIETIVTIPGATTQKLLQLGVAWQTSVIANEKIRINEIEIVQLLNTAPEYQYNLKDHLGNTRLTFTTKQETISEKATMETANANTESEQFLYYDEAKKVNEPIFDKTNGTTGTYYATRLTGGTTNAIYGLAKSISVMPGDVVNMEVYAKYVDTNTANWTAALTTLMTGIANGTAQAGVSVDGGAAGSLGGGSYPFAPLNHSSETGTAPKAYLNYIMFNKDMTTVLGSGFQRITTNSREYGQDVAHDKLALTYTAKEPGYLYIYLSNENPTAVEVYFDDFKVDHIKSPIVQVDDYYAFGLTYNSYSRENTVENKYLFNGGSELQTDLSLGFYSTLFRTYDPAIGRFMQIDPLADFFPGINPYSFALDNPISYGDPDGLGPIKDFFQRLFNPRTNFIKVSVNGKMTQVAAGRKPPREKKRESDRTPNRSLDPGVHKPKETKNLAKIETKVEPEYYEHIKVDMEPEEISEPEQPSPPTINGKIVNENTSIGFDHSPFGGNSSALVDRHRTDDFLEPIAEVLKKNPHLAITIQILTNLPNNQLDRLNNINGGVNNGTLRTVMWQRGAAIQRALLDMRVSQRQVLFNFVPGTRSGILIDFRKSK